jgi:hypothetical protein
MNLSPGSYMIRTDGSSRNFREWASSKGGPSSGDAMVADCILALATIYLSLGVLVGVPFGLWGAHRVDTGAAGAPFAFRLIILPGVVMFWPSIARRWRQCKW